MPSFFSNRIDSTAQEVETTYRGSHRQSNSRQDSFTPANLEENVNYTMTSYLNSAYRLFRNNIPVVLITLYLLYKEFSSGECPCSCPCTNTYIDAYNPPREHYYLEASQDEICPILRGYGR